MISALKIIFLLGFLIFIHEFGHFIIARLCKIDVNEFSIGFGPKILSRKKGETIYELRLIPLGGFVKLEGEEEHSEKEGSFNKASIPRRIAVLVAGGLVNISFGLLLYQILITIRYFYIVEPNCIQAILFGFNSVIHMIADMTIGIGQLLFGGLTLNDMTGPVGISSMVSQTNGIIEFLYLLSIISVSLGITNLLPFPPLDGGKVAILILEAIRKKPIKEESEMKIQSIGFFILIALSIMITIHDITNIGK